MSSPRLPTYTDAMLENCPSTSTEKDFQKIIDNVITWSTSITVAFNRICSIFSHCNKNGLVFNPTKFRFAKQEVEFAGFLIPFEGIKPAAKYTEAIKEFPTPSIILKVRAWYGLVNQVTL